MFNRVYLHHSLHYTVPGTRIGRTRYGKPHNFRPKIGNFPHLFMEIKAIYFVLDHSRTTVWVPRSTGPVPKKARLLGFTPRHTVRMVPRAVLVPYHQKNGGAQVWIRSVPRGILATNWPRKGCQNWVSQNKKYPPSCSLSPPSPNRPTSLQSNK